jgi:hypothetical protein
MNGRASSSTGLRRPEPTALLNASIFFDLRPLFGDFSLAETLRSLLLSMTTVNSAFLHLMATNAIQAMVPLGFLGRGQRSWERRRRNRSKEIRQPDFCRCSPYFRFGQVAHGQLTQRNV